MGKRRMMISYDVMREALHLPENVKIVNTWDGHGIFFYILMESDEFENIEVGEGCELPLVSAIVHHEAEKWTYEWQLEK